eukprot:1028809-Rhodomonas_salina.1
MLKGGLPVGAEREAKNLGADLSQLTVAVIVADVDPRDAGDCPYCDTINAVIDYLKRASGLTSAADMNANRVKQATVNMGIRVSSDGCGNAGVSDMIANVVLTAMQQESVAHSSYSLPSLNTNVPQILMLSSGQDTFNNATCNPTGIRILGQMSEINPSPRPTASI